MKLSLATSTFVVASIALSASTGVARADDEEAPRATARVHVRDASDALVVQRWDGEWVTVCTGACNRELDVGATYRISGSGIRASHSFALDAKPGDDVELAFDLKSSGKLAAGVALTATGAFLLTVSAAFTVGTSIIVFAPSSSSGDGAGALAALALGGMVAGGALVVGLSTFIPGVVLMAHNGPSKIASDALPAPPPPVFREARESLPTPAFTAIPIWSGTF